jgi:DNA-binding transcriptional LysR family regulator
MDRFEAMILLREAVDRGSLSAASRALRVPVPTLSRKITDLETRLGTKLLVRTTRSLALTDAGVAYLAAARRILDELDGAEREAAGEFSEPKGDLVLTAPLQFGRLHVLPVVADFLGQFPLIDIRLRLSDRNIHLVDDHVDMAVRIGRLADSAMVATRIGTMRIVAAASPALLAKHGIPARPADLRDLPAVAVDGPMPEANWRFYSQGHAAPIDVPLKPRLCVTTTEAAVDAAIRGVGIVRLLHYQVVEAVEAGRLHLVLEDFEPEPAPVHLVHASRGQMPLKLRRFLDVAAPFCANGFPGFRRARTRRERRFASRQPRQ